MLKKPKKFSIHLYLDHERFTAENWEYEVGEELHIMSKTMMDEAQLPLARDIRDGVRGVIGQIEIDYDDDGDEPSTTSEKPHNSGSPTHVNKRDTSGNLKQELADLLISIAAKLSS